MSIQVLSTKLKRSDGKCGVCKRPLLTGSRFEWAFFSSMPDMPIPAHTLCVTPISRERQVQYFVDHLVKAY